MIAIMHIFVVVDFFYLNRANKLEIEIKKRTFQVSWSNKDM